MHRLASYRKVPKGYNFQLCFLKLSEAGFYYSGEKLKVRCEGCHREISLEDMNHDEHVLDPRDAKFHNSECEFVKHADVEMADSFNPNSSKKMNETETNGRALHNLGNGLSHSNELEVRVLQSKEYKHKQFKGMYIFDDSIDIDHEIEKHNRQNGIQCDKNPGHYGYFSVNVLKLEYLPGLARKPYVLKLLQLFSLLTVRVMVKLKNASGFCHQFGTGFVSLDMCDNQTSPYESNGMADSNGFNEVYITTSRNLVQSGIDPGDVTVDFCCDDQVQGQTRSITVASVLTFEHNRDYKAILVCRISDAAFFQLIYQTRRQILELVGNIPDSVKDFLSKKVFLIHHPHGRDKVVSHGDFVQVKHKLVTDDMTGSLTLQKISGNEPVKADDMKDIMKMLMYTADTCHGSSGAPVITFTSRTSNSQRDLDIWIHNGQHKAYGLSCSNVKACKLNDFEMVERTVDKVTFDSEASCKHHEKSSKTPPLPSYPAFITKQKRLDSFVNWGHQHIYEPEYLANIGFFYA
ncbi:baculoviral IAP repeat-containing protein 7, partial [Biomphalaria pfeifferi]